MTAPKTDIQRTDAFMAQLGAEGVEVWRVGGSVRAEILGQRANDADYMVRGIALAGLGRILLRAGGKPSVMKDRSGRALGWRTPIKGGGFAEITLPRREISTGPGHRDFDIVLDPNLPLHEDCQRRDFTINALYKLIAAPPGVGGVGVVADPTACGLYDLQHKIIRTTHEHSFRDDPLRILRALRFAATLGYDLAEVTQWQMEAHADAVDGLTADGNISGTVLAEMSKLLMGADVAKALRIAASRGVLGSLFPELAPMIGFEQDSRYHDMTTDEHTFTALETAAKIDAPLRVRWALLFHDAGKPETAWKGEDGRLHYYARKDIDWIVSPHMPDKFNLDHEEQSEFLWRSAAARMNVDKRLREDVATLVRNHMLPCTGKVKPSKVRRNRVRFGDDLLRDLHMMRMCDLCGKGTANRKMLINVAQQEDIRSAAQFHGIPASRKDLQVDGRDAMALGMAGHWIGGALDVLLDEVVCEPDNLRLSREWQLERLTAQVAHRKNIDRLAEAHGEPA